MAGNALTQTLQSKKKLIVHNFDSSDESPPPPPSAPPSPLTAISSSLQPCRSSSRCGVIRANIPAPHTPQSNPPPPPPPPPPTRLPLPPPRRFFWIHGLWSPPPSPLPDMNHVNYSVRSSSTLFRFNISFHAFERTSPASLQHLLCRCVPHAALQTRCSHVTIPLGCRTAGISSTMARKPACR